MIPYYLFFMFFGLGACLDYVRQDDQNVQQLKTFVLVAGIMIILFFVGFRYKIGSDWFIYLQSYNEVIPLDKLFLGDNLNFSNDFLEPGYKILTSLCSYIGLNFFMFVFLVTGFNTFSLFYFLYKNNFRNKFVVLAIILILTVFLEFDILRQSIAFHIVLFALVGEKIKAGKLFLCTVLAMTFHYTAIIFVVFYFFQKLNITKTRLGIVMGIYIISLFVTLPVITSILTVLEPITGGVIKAIVIKGQNLVNGFSFSRNISFTSILNVAFIMLLFVNYNRLKEKLTFTELTLIKMFLFYILLNSMLKEVQEVADRFSYYYNLGIAFMFALLSSLVRIRELKRVLIVTPCVFIMMRLFLHFRQDPILYGQTPYRNYFFMKESDELIIQNRYDIMNVLKLEEGEKKKD